MSASDLTGDLAGLKPRRGPGRPRKVTSVTKQEYIDEAPTSEGDGEAKDESFAGLFDEALLKTVARVRVVRREPNEGTVGYLEDPMSGEAEIFERWGGSTYLVQAIDAKGIVRKQSVIKIAGDPVFVSSTAETQWRRSRGLPPVTSTSQNATQEKGLSFHDLLMLMQTQDEKRRHEERAHQERMRQLELEARERERRDDEERDKRRAREEEERETRRRREQEAADARSQQFMANTIQMIQQSNTQALQFVKATATAEHKPDSNNNLMDAVKTVVAIKEAFAGDGGDGGGEETVLQTLIKHGGEWVNGLGNGIVGAIREVKGGGVNGQTANTVTPHTPQSGVRPMTVTSPLAMLPASHPLNEKVETLVAKLAAKGLDPLAAMDTIVSNVLNDVDKIPQQGKTSTTSAATAPAKPYVQGPVGVATTTTVTTSLAPSNDNPNVVRMKFKR